MFNMNELKIVYNEDFKKLSTLDLSRIIFLDIDGVLNSYDWYLDDRNPGNINGQEGDLDPLCIGRINFICDKMSAKIVISSDWRYETGFKLRLERAGLKNIVGYTPIFTHRKLTRGQEIFCYTNIHPEIKQYCIIDDTDDILQFQLPHFVKINSMRGFLDEDIERVCKILDKNDN